MLHYNITGNGPHVVLIHGFCEDNTCFNEQVFLLKDHYTVITPDLPGFGQSATLTQTSMASMADKVYELLASLHITSCAVFGHSMGGYVTLALVHKYPDMVTKFGLIHSTAFADDEARKQKRNQAIRLVTQKGALFYALNFIPPLFKENTPIEKIKPCLDAAATFSNNGLIEALEAMKQRQELTEVLKSTNKPVFWGIGKYDNLILPDSLLSQAALCKLSYVAWLGNSAHMGHIEEASELANHLQRFLKG